MTAKETDWIYTLNCRNCGIPYETEEGFPEPQFCPQCLIPYKEGVREVVDWLFGVSTAQEVDFPPKMVSFAMTYEAWQAKLKEWGITSLNVQA